jgi:hypothetical protein
MTKRVMRDSTPSPTLVTPERIALSDSENAEILADGLENQFQPVLDPWVSAVIEMVNVALRSYILSLSSETKLTNHDKFHLDMRNFKFSKASNLNGIPNMAPKHTHRAVSLFTHIFNVIFCTHLFPQVWKHARVISFLILGKDLALSSSYRPISLLDTISKLSEISY